MNISHALKKPAQVIAALLLMGTGIGSAQAAILENGSFEVLGTGGVGLAGWTINPAGSVARGSSGGVSDGSYAAILNPGSNPSGELEQTFTTTPGLGYTLEFDYGVWGAVSAGPQQVRVQVQRTGDASFALNEVVANTGTGGAVAYQTFNFGFIAEDPEMILRFIDLSSDSVNGNFNMNLDRASVNPIPLPPAAWLLGSALFGMLAIGKRKRQS